jgi:N-acetyl-anhydromuramyl-L-alanine amidase AmpD
VLSLSKRVFGEPRPPDAKPIEPATPKATGRYLDAYCDDPADRCAVYSPIRSNKSLAKKGRKVAVNFDYFGASDCRVTSKRSLSDITLVVLHQGGYSAKQNMQTWACRPGASHYTIDRDGTIYQHVGEEWNAWHAGSGPGAPGAGANDISIGIELALPQPSSGPNCNQIKFTSKTPEHQRQVMDACRPSADQYVALQGLLQDIAARTSFTLDESHVLGHCEVSHGGHEDPRGVDWSGIGLSNEKKKQQVADLVKKTGESMCEWYLPFGDGD